MNDARKADESNAEQADPSRDRAAPAWHALEGPEVAQTLEVGESGLAADEAAARLERHGPNRLPTAKGRSALVRFLAQFHNLLIYVLLVAAAMAALMGHLLDSVVILAVCVVNAIIGFVQEGKAERALESIREMLSLKAVVVREGERTTVPAEGLVPGDVVLLEAGDRVPADLRLLQVKGLHSQEAALTGESMPVEKTPAPVAAEAPLAERSSMTYSGTLVTSGQGRGVVVATGSGTELGRISELLAEVTTLTTPLIEQMEVFARWLTVVILAVATVVFAFGLLVRGLPLDEMFMAGVSLGVAAIPEGLPAILTVALAIGVQRMAGRNAIIRRLPAVETLGSVSVICSDKTGTLTRNEMTVGAVAIAGGIVDVSGVGYEPHGELHRDGEGVEPDGEGLLAETLRAGLLCNDAVLRRQEETWTVDGDPLEGALIAVARKAGLDPAQEASGHPRLDVIPFESGHRFMATLHHDHAGHHVVYLKGAPERVIELCDRQRGEDGRDEPIDADAWLAQVETLAGRGQRVLAVALAPREDEARELEFATVEGGGFVLLGLFGLIDPPREEAIEAVTECRQAGIRVKMITGDHAATAGAVAAQLGLENTERVVTGAEIDGMEQSALEALAEEVDVFARTTPEHKLRLVEALQSRGRVVAMTGDGVNDAPALKRADIGIAMGEKGTEAAKEASEMVLTDDNFASIAAAVRQGRTVYDNLKKAIVFLLPVNGGESMAIVVAVLFALTLPITPLQILWINMVSSVGLALALAFEPTEPDVMHRPPRPAGEPLLSGFLLWRIGLVSLLFLAGIFGMFQWALAGGASVEEARTIAVNTLVVMEVFYLFSVRYLRTPSLTWEGLLGTRPVLVAITVVTTLQLVFTYAPLMHLFFDTRPVGIGDGMVILSIGVALLFVLEGEKLARRRLGFDAGTRARA